MPRYSQGSECTEVSPVSERHQAERDDDKEDGLLVDMPAKQEGCVATERHCTDKCLPCGSEQEPDEERLHIVSSGTITKERQTYYLEAHSK